jgi:hypothetical protein
VAGGAGEAAHAEAQAALGLRGGVGGHTTAALPYSATLARLRAFFGHPGSHCARLWPEEDQAAPGRRYPAHMSTPSVGPFVPTGKKKWRENPVAARTAFIWCYKRSAALRRRMMEIDAEWRQRHGLPAGRFPGGAVIPMTDAHRDLFWLWQLFNASLMPLIEGWEEVGYRDSQVDALLQERDRIARIGGWRNSVWHFNAHNDRRVENYEGDREHQLFVVNLHQAFGEFAVRLADAPETELQR